MIANRLTRILVVDDHPLLRDGLRALIASDPNLELVAEAATGTEGISLFKAFQPDVTVMDLRLPDMSGVEAIIAIRGGTPEARIVVLTTYLSDVQTRRALKAGASAFLLKHAVRTELIDTIRAVEQGKKRLDQRVAAELAEHAEDSHLSQEELEILEQLVTGQSVNRIAKHLGIKQAAVQTHLESLLAKLHAKDQTHAAAIAVRRGFLEV